MVVCIPVTSKNSKKEARRREHRVLGKYAGVVAQGDEKGKSRMKKEGLVIKGKEGTTVAIPFPKN